MSKYTSRSESDVGIRLRLGKQPRLCAVIKDRYSDFHVNEIDPDGNIVKLTSLAPPVDNSAAEALKDPQIMVLIPEDVRQKVGEMQERLSAAVDKRNIKNDKECVEIKVTDFDKESRTRIHRWISTFDKLNSETMDKDGDKFITIVAMKGNDRGKRRPANRAKYTYCVLYKEGVETSDAIGFIAKKLNMNPGFISYAGIKDKRAKTSQRLCISNIEASRLVSICKYRQNIKLGNFVYHSKPIALGDLKGNHFKLLLKNLRFSEGDEAENLGLNDVVTSAMESLSSYGFINYYGMQRFGSYAVSTHQVGLEILKQNWIKAFDLLLSPKPNDPSFLAKAKDLWFKERDPIGARSMLPSRFVSIESNLLHGLARSYGRNDFLAVFLNMPRQQRLLYVHAYQSLIWNRLASFRVEEYGIDSPVVGDLVYVGEGEEEIVELDVNDVKEQEHSVSDRKSASNKLEVRTLTQEDINSEKYTIYDVLIPLYGSDVKFPENKTKDFLTKMLEDEGISSDCFERFRPIGDKPTGGYRKLLVRPTNVSHTLHTYSDSDNLDSYIKSDWDELKEASSSSNEESVRTKEDDSSTINTTDSSTSKKTCLVVAFSLPSSAYATMALREILVEQDKSCHRNDDANKISRDEPSTKEKEDDPIEGAEPSQKKAKVVD